MKNLNSTSKKPTQNIKEMFFSDDLAFSNRILNLICIFAILILFITMIMRLYEGMPAYSTIQIRGSMIIAFMFILYFSYVKPETADKTLSVPITFVFTASIGKNSQEGTCFKAAALKT